MPDRSNLARVTKPAREQRAPATPRKAPTPRPSRVVKPQPTQRVGDGPLLAVILTVLAVINIYGARYYSLPAPERVRSPLHAWFRASGYVGQSAGYLALAIFVFLWLYPLRQKYRSLAWTGSITRWLDIHILTALGMPLLLTIHAAWQFRGLIGMGFTSMMIVVASGVVGRYLYMHIPRSVSGMALSMEEVGTRRKAILEQIAQALGLEVKDVEETLAITVPPASKSTIGALMQLMMNDFERWRMLRRLRRRWTKMIRNGSFSFRVDRQRRRISEKKALVEAVQLASREVALEQQARMLGATNNLFRFWHVAHRPFAITAGIAVIIHVVLVIYLGETWIKFH